jgi:nitroimidazol reductase NimA-like FMN-containing flavoprotein (pyridoxamine 5'-phosphate oxidase superfamily)
MEIRELSKEECHRALAGKRLARLACALNDQPYIVPVYLAYHKPSVGEACFYGFTTVGQKVDWMRTNPRVCIEVDEIASWTEWTTVLAMGRYQELPDVPEQNARFAPARRSTGHLDEAVPDQPALAAEALVAYQLLQTEALWWEPASTGRAAVTHHAADEVFRRIYYKVSIEQVTGREARPDRGPASSSTAPTSNEDRIGRLRRALTRIFRGRPVNTVAAF